MIRTTLPSIMFFGCEAADEYAQMMYTILGPDCCYATEEEFCIMTGCPPEGLEDWLLRDFIQHNIQDVERWQENAGAHPVILSNERGAFSRYACFRRIRSGSTVRHRQHYLSLNR